MLGGVVDGAGILRHIEARNADRASGAGDLHHLVEDDGRLLAAGKAARLEAHGVDRAVDLVRARDLGDQIAQAIALGQIDGLEADLAACASRSLLKSLIITTAAPRKRAEAAAASPTSPAPAT